VGDGKPRRLRAKPEALAARGKLAEGTQPGTVAVAAETQLRSVVNALHVGHLAQDLQQRTAERDRALELLAQLERIITATGGYMVHTDQVLLREAQALLVQFGKQLAANRVT
jgi:hypothetical protein